MYLNSSHMSMFICFICSDRDICCDCFSKQERQRSHLLASAAMVFFDIKILIVTKLRTGFHHDMVLTIKFLRSRSDYNLFLTLRCA